MKFFLKNSKAWASLKDALHGYMVILYISQHKDIEEMEKVWNNDFENICHWFDNKLSIHSVKDKTKSILSDCNGIPTQNH